MKDFSRLCSFVTEVDQPGTQRTRSSFPLPRVKFRFLARTGMGVSDQVACGVSALPRLWMLSQSYRARHTVILSVCPHCCLSPYPLAQKHSEMPAWGLRRKNTSKANWHDPILYFWCINYVLPKFNGLGWESCLILS